MIVMRARSMGDRANLNPNAVARRRANVAIRLATRAIAALLVVSAPVLRLQAGDWPQFLGPSRDGVSPEKIADSWPAGGPEELWRFEVGEGFSGPVVAGDRLVIVHRIDDEEVVDCLDASSGKRLWNVERLTGYRDDYGSGDGPRATPAIAGGSIYTFGADGVLRCLELSDGDVVWTVDTAKKFRVRKGFFGAACSPLVEGSRVLMHVGGEEESGIVAFDRDDGGVVWKATDHDASYSSPVVATIRGARHGFFFTRRGLVDVDPVTGKVRWEFRWRARINASVNAATPLVLGDRVFISTSYNVGAALLEVGDSAPEVIWKSDEALTNHYATSIHHDGFLFGFHGRQEAGPELRCIEAATGTVRWRSPRGSAGCLIRAGDRLIVLHESGELTLVDAKPDKFTTRARAKPLSPTVRAYPALAGGRLYVRDERRLLCLRVGESPSE